MAIPPDLVTVAEAAKILHRSIEQVRRYLREGKLPGERIGQQWFVRRSVLRAWQNGTSEYQRRMELLKEVQSLRQKIYAETGRLFDGAAMVRRSREERLKELVDRLP